MTALMNAGYAASVAMMVAALAWSIIGQSLGYSCPRAITWFGILAAIGVIAGVAFYVLEGTQ
jgi:hypothetical protein